MFEFYGYNNGKAIAIRNQYNLQIITLIFAMVCLLISPLAFIFKIYSLLWCWLAPLLLFILSFLVLLFEKYDNSVFLKGQKQKHKFVIKDNKMFKEGKEIKSLNCIKIREHKKILFIELKQSYYIIYKSELACSVKDLIKKIKDISKYREETC